MKFLAQIDQFLTVAEEMGLKSPSLDFRHSAEGAGLIVRVSFYHGERFEALTATFAREVLEDLVVDAGTEILAALARELERWRSEHPKVEGG